MVYLTGRKTYHWDVDWDHPKIELKIEEWKVKTRKNNCKAARGRSATSKWVHRGLKRLTIVLPISPQAIKRGLLENTP